VGLCDIGPIFGPLDVAANALIFGAPSPRLGAAVSPFVRRRARMGVLFGSLLDFALRLGGIYFVEAEPVGCTSTGRQSGSGSLARLLV
jgi:hypothetical protein